MIPSLTLGTNRAETKGTQRRVVAADNVSPGLAAAAAAAAAAGIRPILRQLNFALWRRVGREAAGV
jgi:hypothetical protein